MVNLGSPLSIAGAGFTLSYSGNGRTTVPVSPSNFIYSHFKHVSGVPAPEGVRGVAVNKIKILDTIIERLSKMRSQRNAGFDGGGPDLKSEKQIDLMIEQLQKQLNSAAAARAPLPYTPAAQIPAGSFFNVAA